MQHSSNDNPSPAPALLHSATLLRHYEAIKARVMALEAAGLRCVPVRTDAPKR